MPAPDRQRVFNGAGVAGTAFQLAVAQPRPLQRQADSGPARWTTLLGRARQCIFWTYSAQPWVVLPEQDQCFETQPEDLLT